MKRRLMGWLLLLGVALGLSNPRQLWAAGACTCAPFNDWKDAGCRLSPGGNQAKCPTCPPCCNGMPRWSVSEPYINLHIADEPLSYATSSGQQMTFRFLYK